MARTTHNFNNILCGIVGFLDLSLMDQTLNPMTRNHLEQARECALEAARTFRNALGNWKGMRENPGHDCEPKRETAPGQAFQNPPTLKVLIVEDEETIARFLEEVLSQLGHHPRIVFRAEEALNAAENEEFHLLMTDLELPDKRGDQLAREIRLRWPNLSTILLTGRAELTYNGQTLPGIDHVLSKPVSIDRLEAMIGKTIASSWSAP